MRKVWSVAVLGFLGISLLLAAPTVAVPTGCDVATCITAHDTLPNFAGHPTIRSVRSGAWSEPTTWDRARRPGALDVVQITSGTTVTYDLADAYVQVIGIHANAVLTFRTDISTRLTVGTLLVLPQGTLQVGTPLAPVEASVLAEVVIADQPLDILNDGLGPYDPLQYGTGLLALDATVTMHGTPKSGFVRLAAEPLAGHTTLTLEQPPTGWLPGDTLLLPDSRHVVYVEGQFTPQWELPRLDSGSGTRLTLTTPLRWAHLGARDRQGHLDLLPHVANLTRNVIVRSEHPTGTRGHVWLTGRSTVDLQYVQFQELGRTTTAPLNNTTVDVQGQVTHLGTNQIGRYALHLHHLPGPVRAPASGAQYRLRGNVLHGGDADHHYKWALAIHDTHYGLVQDNVLWNCAGACLLTEDGSETANVIEHNLAVRSTGTGDRMGLGSEQTGFWFRGPNNIVRDNVAANIHGAAGQAAYGFSQWQYYAGTVRIPTGPGADMSLPSQYTLTSLYTLPLREFRGNEVYSSPHGMTAWWVGTEGQTPRATADSVIKDLRLWHIWATPYVHYPAHRLVLDGLVIRGSRHTPTWVAVQGGDYLMSDFVLQNADIQGVEVGIIPSTDSRGTQQIAQSLIEAATVGIRLDTLWTSAAWADGLKPRRVEVVHSTILRLGNSAGFKRYAMNYNATPARNLIAKDELVVRGEQGQAGQDFQVYYREQAPAFVMPPSILDPNNGRPRVWAAPVPGLSNAATWSTYGLAIAGVVAPCATTRADIQGWVCGAHPAALLPPTLLTHPTSVTLAPGHSATLTVAATGTAPLSYQWQKNGTPITGATAASYTTPPVGPADSGATFRCVVTNAAGTVTSQAATLTVKAAAVPPSLSVQPTNQTVTVGQSATFSITATGTAPLSYQWQKNGTPITGATAASYTTPPVGPADSGATFRCVVTNAAGTVTSQAATLTVKAAAAGTVPGQAATPTVKPPRPGANQAPSVNAGSNQTVFIETRKHLRGTVTDAGLPKPPGKVMLTWSKVIGPGKVTFGNPSALETTVSFSRVGTYILQLKATDGALTSRDHVQIVVRP